MLSSVDSLFIINGSILCKKISVWDLVKWSVWVFRDQSNKVFILLPSIVAGVQVDSHMQAFMVG